MIDRQRWKLFRDDDPAGYHRMLQNRSVPPKVYKFEEEWRREEQQQQQLAMINGALQLVLP